jgi:hypothetical protein
MEITDESQRHAPGEMVATLRDRRDLAGRTGRADGRAQGAAARREDAGETRRRVLQVARAARGGRGTGSSGCAASTSTCARARSSASRASPATGSRNCWRCWPASARPGRAVTAERRGARPDLAGPTARPAARAASPMSPRTATAAGWSCPSRLGEHRLGYHHATAYNRRTPADGQRRHPHRRARQDGALRRPPADPRLKARESFSGGNQQKIVLAREMERDPDLLLVGQPTRGVDIGAIEFIHQQLIALRDAGQGDPAGLGRARRDPVAVGPHRW